MKYIITAIDMDECCSYVRVGSYDSMEDIPARFLIDKNYELEIDYEDEED